MSPLWQFKAVSVFLYYNLPHAPSSQPFLILHFVAAREAPLFSSASHKELWRYSEACAAENYCLREHVRGSGFDFKDKPKGSCPDGSESRRRTKQSRHRAQQLWRSLASRRGGKDLRKVCSGGLLSSLSCLMPEAMMEGLEGGYYFEPTVR